MERFQGGGDDLFAEEEWRGSDARVGVFVLLAGLRMKGCRAVVMGDAKMAHYL